MPNRHTNLSVLRFCYILSCIIIVMSDVYSPANLFQLRKEALQELIRLYEKSGVALQKATRKRLSKLSETAQKQMAQRRHAAHSGKTSLTK